MKANKRHQNCGLGIGCLVVGAGMRTALFPRDVVAVLKCQKDPIKALEMFNSVRKEDGFKHTLVTYKCMIEKLGNHGKFEEMENLLSEMRLNIDNGLLEGVYIGSMKNYGKKRKIQQAVDIFERMDFFNCEQSVQSYNAIMNILVDNGYFNQAHKVYMRMIHKKIVPDVYTFTIRIKSFSQMGWPAAALRLFRNMPLQGCKFNAEAYCTVIGGFYEQNDQGEAYKLFLEMYSLDINPSVKTFNKLMHILCRNGDVQESKKLLSKVLKRGLIPNMYTFNVLIQGLCKRSELHEAIKLFESVSKEGLIPDVVTYNTLILGLSNNCKALEAENFLHKMVSDGVEPNNFTYNTIISGYCEMGMIGNADKMLNDAMFKGFVPDEFTYHSLISGFCQAGDISRAIALVKELLVKGFKPTLLLYNRLIKGLCQKGLVLEAVAIMTKMSQFGSSPDMWTYNLVINALCKMGCLSDASCLIDNAITEGYLPDVCTFNTLVDGYCKQLKLDNAIEIVNRMWEDYGVTPDIITYNSLLNGLCKVRKFEDVIETFNAFLEKGCSPNVCTYNPVIESLCKLRKVDKALNLLEEMQSRGIPVDIVCVGTLLNGFCLNGDLNGAFHFFEKAEKLHKVSHTTGTFNIMINTFSEKLDMSMALKLFNDMDRKNCAPDGYTYRVMISGFCKTGSIDSGYKFLLEELDKGFVPTMCSFGKVLNCLCMDNRIQEAVGIIRIMVLKEIVPEAVKTIFESDKKEVAAPKIVVDDMLKKSHITYSTFELLYDGVRDKKLMRKKLPCQRALRS